MTLVQPYGMQQGERLLHLCIGASIVFHAILLISAPRLPEALPPPVRFSATLRQAVAPHPPEPTAPAPVQETSPLKPVKPPPVARPTPTSVPPTPTLAEQAPAKPIEPAPTPTPAPVIPASTPSPEASPPAPAAPVAEPRELAKAAAPVAPSPPSGPSDVDLVNAYQSQLAQVAGRYEDYPNEARRNNWVGAAVVRMRIGVDGNVAAVEIVTTSGHKILDEQARVNISKAKSFVQIPPGLRGKVFVVSLRITFRLKD